MDRNNLQGYLWIDCSDINDIHSGLFTCCVFPHIISRNNCRDRKRDQQEKSRQGWKRRYFVLQKVSNIQAAKAEHIPTDSATGLQLVYYKDEKRRKIVGSINLEDLNEVDKSLDSPVYDHLFSIRTTHKGAFRTYYLAASSNEEMNAWVQTLSLELHLEETAPLEPVAPTGPSPNLAGRYEAPPIHPLHPMQVPVKQEPLPAPPLLNPRIPDDYFPLENCTSNPIGGVSPADIVEDDVDRLTSVPDYTAPPPPMKRGPTQRVVPERSEVSDSTYDMPPSQRPDMESVYKVPPNKASLRNQRREVEEPIRMDSTYDVPPPSNCSRNSLPRDSTYDVPPSKGALLVAGGENSLPRDSTYDVPPPQSSKSPRNSASSHGSRSSSGGGKTDDSGYSERQTIITEDTYDVPKLKSTGQGSDVPPPLAHQTFNTGKVNYVNLDAPPETPPKQPGRKMSNVEMVTQFVPVGPNAGEQPSYINTPGQVPSNNGPAKGYMPMDKSHPPGYLPMAGMPTEKYVPPSYMQMTGQQRESYMQADPEGVMEDIYDIHPTNRPVNSSPTYTNTLPRDGGGDRESVYQYPPSTKNRAGLNSTIPAPSPSLRPRQPTHDVLSLGKNSSSLDTSVPVATPASPAEVSLYVTHPANIPAKHSGSRRSPPPPIPQPRDIKPGARTRSFTKGPRRQDILLPKKPDANESSDDNSTDEEKLNSSLNTSDNCFPPDSPPARPPPPQKSPTSPPTLLSSPPPPSGTVITELQYLDLDLPPENASQCTRSPGPMVISSTTEYREIDFVKTDALSATKKDIEHQRKSSEH